MLRTPREVMAEHAELVRRLKKDGKEILKTIDPSKLDLWHMATLVAGEALELLDAVKKHVVYNQELDLENIVEELGDIEFGLEGVRTNLQIPREVTLVENIHKLNKRYPSGGYTDSDAQIRADKPKETTNE